VKKRILLADTQVSVREMLMGMLANDLHHEVIGHASSGVEALEMCRKNKPDLLILDLVLPELCGVELLRRAGVLQPRPRLLVFSTTFDPNIIVEALRCAPDGFVMKTDSLQSLREAIGALLRGGSYFTSHASEHLFRLKTQHNRELSLRQREVLQLIAEGRSSKEISTRLSLSVKTVENHRTHLMEKLDLHTVAALTRYAVKLGLVSIE
jgi:DNA-binding NarL/FixJ family response regulator